LSNGADSPPLGRKALARPPDARYKLQKLAAASRPPGPIKLLPIACPMKPIIVIPARMASSRLPGKPLADIHGEPMIVHVWRRAMEADIGPVLVACAEAPIAEAVERVGGKAILTDPALSSGSDRVHAALEQVDPAGTYDLVINPQGDTPTFGPGLLHALLAALADPAVDIATLAAEIHDPHEAVDPNVVKVALEIAPGAPVGRAIYFSRVTIPSGDGPYYHHEGMYAFRRASLRRFVALPASRLEQSERLEQLRALVAGMRIDVAVVPAVPWGVNTPADLERVRTMMRLR
jgi:3-deoxy-manno-octulosonate cytidylyltransferase (CMP-KDO synthetase)